MVNPIYMLWYLPMTTYPALTRDKLLPLKVIAQRMKDSPDYLGAECPYEPDVKAWLELNLVAGKRAEKGAEKASDGVVGGEVDILADETWDDIARKARRLYSELEEVQKGLGAGDTGEAIQLIKAKAGLLERLVTVGDKALGHKAVAEFRRVVLGVMDDVLSADQRTLLMSRLGSGEGEV